MSVPSPLISLFFHFLFFFPPTYLPHLITIVFTDLNSDAKAHIDKELRRCIRSPGMDSLPSSRS